MDQLLVISALGHDRPGIVNELSRTILDCKGNIVDSRMSVLGGEFAVILLVSGEETSIARLDADLMELGKATDLTINTRKTLNPDLGGGRAPYRIEIVSIDHPGIVYKISNYLTRHKINIQDLSTNRYPAPHTGTAMFAVDMTVAVPGDTNIGRFREEFIDYCDELNLDAAIEAIR